MNNVPKYKTKNRAKNKTHPKKGWEKLCEKEDDPKKVHNPKHTIMLLI